MEVRVGVCLVGYGYAGRVFHAPLIDSAKNLELRCLVTSQSAHEVEIAFGRAIACFKTIKEAASSPFKFDCVVVASPNRFHAELALEAIELGKHVVVDKPFVVTVGEADTVLAAAAARNILVTCFHNRKWDSDFLSTQTAISQLGTLFCFRSEWKRWRPVVKDNWRWVSGEPAGGLLWDLGPHMLHQAIVLFGAPSTVYCESAVQRSGSHVDDYFHLTLSYTDRPRFVCHLEAGCLYHNAFALSDQRTFYVYGERGSWEKLRGIDSQEGDLKMGRKPRSDGWGREKDEDRGILHLVGQAPQACDHVVSDYVDFYEKVGEAILGQGSPPIAPKEARLVMVVLEAAVDSSKKGCRVKVLE